MSKYPPSLQARIDSCRGSVVERIYLTLEEGEHYLHLKQREQALIHQVDNLQHVIDRAYEKLRGGSKAQALRLLEERASKLLTGGGE